MWKTTGTDLIYLEITSSRFTTYDFKGDDFEGGDACYVVTVSSVVTRLMVGSLLDPNLGPQRPLTRGRDAR